MSTTRYFYAGVEYGKGDLDALISYITTRPNELTASQETMMPTIKGTMSGDDYRVPPESFALMCHVLAAVRRSHGEYVLD